MGLKSTSTLNGSTLTFDCKDAGEKDQPASGEGFTRSVDLGAIFGAVGALTLAAIAFAAKTALRNATGGRDIDEAEEAVDARIAAWNNGEWGAERSASGENAPFTAGNILCKAVLRVYSAKFENAAAVATALSAMLAAQLPEGTSWDDLSEENQRKARNAFTKAARAKDGSVDSAIAAIQAEQATERAAKKANPGSSGGLFA